MMEIQLSRGLVAKVDDADYPALARFKWLALCSQGRFYAARSELITPGVRRYRTVLMHRVILGLEAGEIGDHVNHDTLDNRRANLRKATQAENTRNARPHRDSTSRFKGVSWAKNASAWAACIRVDKRKLHLGYFDDEVLAAEAYDAAAAKYFRDFAVFNFPENHRS